MAVFGSSPKDARRFMKAVHHARSAGLFDAMDAGEPMVLRARNVDGLQDEISRLATQGGFDVIMVDASSIESGALSNPVLNNVSASLVLYGFGVGRVDEDVLVAVRDVVARRMDLIREGVGGDEHGVAHAMTMVIVRDGDVDHGMAFSRYRPEDIVA